VQKIGELFKIEREAKDLTPQARHALREQAARPKLLDRKQWLEDQHQDLLPKSPTAGAISYVLKRWEAFTRYLDDGRIAIDNNAAERALREILRSLRSPRCARDARTGCSPAAREAAKPAPSSPA
jgi:hypothetical protein